MIQPHELRIGNMVNTIYGITTIIGVVDNGLEDYAMFIRTDSGHLHRTDGTKSTPIPLTEEWLMKAGFVKRVDSDETHFILGNFILLYHPDCFVLCDVDIHVEITTLHQLQNLYYCLCGEELNVKLS